MKDNETLQGLGIVAAMLIFLVVIVAICNALPDEHWLKYGCIKPQYREDLRYQREMEQLVLMRQIAAAQQPKQSAQDPEETPKVGPKPGDVKKVCNRQQTKCKKYQWVEIE